MSVPANSRVIDQLPKKANLTPAEVAAFLGCHLDTVYELIHSGVIPANKMMRHYRIPREKFLAAYECHTFEPDE